MLTRMMTAAAVFALSTSANALAQSDPDPAVAGDRVVNAMTLQDMRAVVLSYGHEIVDEMTEENGVLVRTPNGFEYILLLKRCDDQAVCSGVLIGTVHAIPEGTTWQLLNRIDSRVDFIGMYVADDRLILDRYIALRGGVRLDQVRHEITTLTMTVPPLIARIEALAAQNTG